ncbi:Lateral signaling target protein [Trichinella pseudospiralis]
MTSPHTVLSQMRSCSDGKVHLAEDRTERCATRHDHWDTWCRFSPSTIFFISISRHACGCYPQSFLWFFTSCLLGSKFVSNVSTDLWEMRRYQTAVVSAYRLCDD